MTGQHECEAFQQRLEERPLRAASREERENLRREAAACAECASRLRMRELLDAPPIEETEAEVPDLYVRGMWLRIRQELKGEAASRIATRRARSGLLVPVLSAAVVVLALGVGLLWAERARLVERQSALAAQLAEQDRRLTSLERTAGELTSGFALLGGADWERVLERRDAVTLGQVREWLASAPAGTLLMGPTELAALTDAAPLRVGGPWRAIEQRIDTRDGLQAGELLEALAALRLPDDETIPTRRLLDIYRETLRSARS